MRRVLLVMVLLATATVAGAQSDTGRHRPAPAPTPAEAARPGAGSAWHVSLNFGLASAGDLFRARAGGSIPWEPEGGTPFGSADFVVTLDEGLLIGAAISRDVGPWLRVRADAAFTELPMTAEARVGETVRLYEYDDLTVSAFTVALEARLIRTPSHPYLMAGVGATMAGGAQTDAYDQTVFAGRFGAGYVQMFAKSLALRFEISNTMQSLDFEDYRPPTSLPIYPALEIENLGPQNILGLTVGLQADF